jgi:hypothetical protein
MGHKINKQNVGNAGEYFIASMLSAQDYIATLTLGRAEKFDILCVAPNGEKKTYKLSVKTRYEKATGFALSKRDENGCADDFFYVFVSLNELKEMPECWVFPSKVINDTLKHISNVWFNVKKKRDGSDHHDVGLRRIDFVVSEAHKDLYPSNWDEIVSNAKVKNSNISEKFSQYSSII